MQMKYNIGDAIASTKSTTRNIITLSKQIYVISWKHE